LFKIFALFLTVCQRHLPVLLATLLVAGLCVAGKPVYQSNDDSFLAMVGAGFGVASQPEPHLVWSHFGYGLILAGLSRLVGPTAHGWATLFTIWLSLTLLIQASLYAQSWKICLVVLLGCLGGVYLISVLEPDFTLTASLSFGAAIASWLVRTGQERPTSRLWKSGIFLALILSFLIRPNAYFMGLVIVGPSIFFLCLGRTRFNRQARILAACLVAIAVLGFLTDKIPYWSSPEWSQATKYFELRTQFNDFARVHWVPDAPEYHRVGWTFNDYAMFVMWYSRDPIYSLENVSFLVQRLAVPTIAMAPQQIWSWLTSPFTSLQLTLLLALQAVIILSVDAQRRRLGLLLILGELAAMMGAAVTGRPPVGSVWMPAAAITLLNLCAVLILTPGQRSSLARRLGLALITALALWSATLVCLDHLQTCREAAAYRRWISANRDLFDGKVVVWDIGLKWEWLVTPLACYSPFPELRVISIDDIACMPVETLMLKKSQIDDLAKELSTNPEMRLLCPKRLITYLIQFCQQHYGIKPAFKECASWEESSIYRLDFTKDKDNQPGTQRQ
jgi:hypothetical protein